MAVTETLLIGIACVLAQGISPEVQKVKEALTPSQQKFIEYIQKNNVCDELERYIQQNENSVDGHIYLMGCGSCIQTSDGGM